MMLMKVLEQAGSVRRVCSSHISPAKCNILTGVGGTPSPAINNEEKFKLHLHVSSTYVCVSDTALSFSSEGCFLTFTNNGDYSKQCKQDAWDHFPLPVCNNLQKPHPSTAKTLL